MAKQIRKAKLVLRAQFTNTGKLQINGGVTRAKNERENEALEVLGSMVGDFLRDMMNMEIPKEEQTNGDESNPTVEGESSPN